MPREVGSRRKRRRATKDTTLRLKQRGAWLEASTRFHEREPVTLGARPEVALSEPSPRLFAGALALSVVTGSYNRLAGLQRTVNSVRRSLRSDVPYEIIVVDGGSTDGTQKWCWQQGDIELIKGDLRGAVPNFNRGFAQAKGRYVCMANDDIEFAGDTLQLALDYMTGHPRCGAGCIPHARPVSSPPWVSLMNVEVGGIVRQWPMAQVALVPRWLGDELGWWGDVTAHYHGDQLLSRCIWESGFTVSVVPDAWLRDYVTDDELRKRNAKMARGVRDAKIYHNAYPTAPKVAEVPTLSPPFETDDKSKPDVDIILGTFNRRKLLQQCIEHARLAARGLKHRLIVVDGGSTDGSLEWLREQPDVLLIETGVLDGAVKAFNRGFARATADFVVNANDDMVFESSLRLARDYLLSRPKVGQLAFPKREKGTGYTTHDCMGHLFANFGMTRRWLGDYVGWWGTWTYKYFGDVHCSLRIWELGYQVERFDGCKCMDYVVEDALRGEQGGKAYYDHDSKLFDQYWPTRRTNKKRTPYVLVPDGPLVRRAEFE